MGEKAKIILNEYSAKNLLYRDTLDLDKFYTADLKLICEVARKETERLKTELQDTKEHLGEYLHEQEEENNRLNNIINELHSDLKTLWIVLWNMDTEMTGYQNEIYDKYYEEFHKGSDKE